jgi:predicted SnoaL-like aldol condensation-catalyzing enzyme
VNHNAPDSELLPDDPLAKLIDTFKQTFAEARAGLPDLSITIEDVMVEGDRVAARVVMRGTHRGEFQGIAPTGKRVEVRAIDMFRISDGKIVEHWGGTPTTPPASCGHRSAPELLRIYLPRNRVTTHSGEYSDEQVRLDARVLFN